MKGLIITLITVASVINLYSQNQDRAYPHITPMTPEAAEFAKYGDYPVSYYSGTPDTSIPLYEVNVDGFKLPISLNYHASGIRVDQEATWVGLGWSLNVGSRISRTVNSADDFMLNYDEKYPFIMGGYYDAPDISSTLYNHYGNGTDTSCHYGPVGCPRYDLLYDPEPDIFFYNLPGMNGKFILDKSRGAVLFDKSHNLKIEILRNTLGTNTVAFKITDSDGNQYLYNQLETTINYSSVGWVHKNTYTNNTVYDTSPSSFPDWSTESKHVTSWCLSKVITKHGREVIFTYETEDQYLPTHESLENYNCFVINNGGFGGRYYYKSKIVNKGLRLKSIEGDFGHVEFNCSTREDIKGTSKKLDLISIYDYQNTLIKSFKFNYTYFNDDYTENLQYVNVFKRLKLDKVTEYSSLNVPLNNGHNFDYHEGSFPPKNSKNVDYWGFQNGKTYGENYYIGLSLSEDLNFIGVRKDANFEKAIIGTLQKITYPAGGSVKFSYESNTLSGGFFNNNIYDGHTNFTYVDLLVYNPYTYNTSPWHVDDSDPPTPTQAVHSFEIQRQTKIRILATVVNNSGIRDLNYYYNAPNVPLGRLRKISPTTSTVYSFSCPNAYEPSPYYYLEAQGLGSEVDIAEREFTLEPGTYEFVAYKPPRDTGAYWRIALPPPVIPVGTPLPPYYGGGIRISEIKTDAKIRKFNYSAGNMLIEPVIHYIGTREGFPEEWDCFVQVSESKTPLSSFSRGNYVGYDWVEEYITDEDGNISKTKYAFYNDTESEIFDDNFPDSPRHINYRNGLVQSVEKYKNTTLVEKEDYTYDSTYSTYIKAFRDKGKAKPGGANGTVGPFMARAICGYYYRIEWPLKSNSVKTLNTDDGNNIISETSYSYNSKDLIQSTSQIVNNSEIIENVKYAFDFNDAISLSMVSKNMIANPVVSETFKGGEKIFEQKTIYKDWGNGLIAPEIAQTGKDLPSTIETRLKYNAYDTKGNPLEIQRPEGLKVSYIWGYKHTLPVAKLENIAYASIPASLIEAIQNATDSPSGTEAQVLAALNALRSSIHADMQKAMITIFTYKPLVGVTSIIDPKGLKTTYEYDSFGRLKFVKDNDGKVLSQNQYHYKL